MNNAFKYALILALLALSVIATPLREAKGLRASMLASQDAPAHLGSNCRKCTGAVDSDSCWYDYNMPYCVRGCCSNLNN